MKHLSEEELLSLQLNDDITQDAQSHFDSCLFCQSELKKEIEFASHLQESLLINDRQTFDIRQKVFNDLKIDFKVEDKKDYFSEISLSLFVIVASVLLYFYPVSFDISALYTWIPIDNMTSYIAKYKMLIMGSCCFVLLYFLDRLKVMIKAEADVSS